MSVFGLLMSTICFFISVDAANSSWYMREENAISALVLSLLFVVCGILGMIFSGNAAKDGNTSVLTKLGKIFGIVGIATFGLDMLIAFITLIS